MRKLNTTHFFLFYSLLKTKTFFYYKRKKDFNEKHNFNIIINKKSKTKI